MRWHKWKCLIGVYIALLTPMTACLGEEENGNLKAELEKLKAEFEEIKASYEARIRTLEKKITEQEGLKATIEEKQKEIRALDEKLAALKKQGELEELGERVGQLEKAEVLRHKAAPVGAYGGLMNPDASLVADVKGLLTDNDTDPLDEKIMLEEAELAIQGYLYPGVRADFIGAVGQHPEDGGRIHTDVGVEEGYVSLLELPANFQLQVGRKLLDFGRLNPIHPHHWAMPDAPLPLRRLFGDDSWYDDGLQVSTLIPNPWKLYFKVQGGIWNGRSLAEDEPEESGGVREAGGFQGPVAWHGHVFTGRATLDLPLSRETNLMAGYSFAGDEGTQNALHGLDLTFIHRWPMTYRKIRWQNEFFVGDFELGEDPLPARLDTGTHDVEAWGLYSLLQLTLTKYWETGARFDWWDGDYLDDEWGATAFLSYYFTHSMYLRTAYSYSRLAGGEDEHAFLLQFVWGLGPHAHRLED